MGWASKFMRRRGLVRRILKRARVLTRPGIYWPRVGDKN
jgi:hypothetical protein